MFEYVLSLHSVLRWGVVVFGALVLLQSFFGMLAAGEPGTLGKRLGLVFLICLDLQILVGLALYLFLSPTVESARGNMGESMKDPVARYWLVEHALAMIVAVILVHVGRILARKARSERAAHTRRFVTTLIALALILVRTPWPLSFSPVERPWIRLPF